MMKNILLNYCLLSTVSAFILIGCAETSNEVEVLFNDQEGLVVEKRGPHILVVGDGRLVARVTYGINKYYIISFANGEESIIFEYNKWDENPRKVERLVKLNGESYSILYDELGEVTKKILMTREPQGEKD